MSSIKISRYTKHIAGSKRGHSQLCHESVATAQAEMSLLPLLLPLLLVSSCLQVLVQWTPTHCLVTKCKWMGELQRDFLTLQFEKATRRAQWHTLGTPALGRQSLEDHEFKATLDYIGSPCLKNKHNKLKNVGLTDKFPNFVFIYFRCIYLRKETWCFFFPINEVIIMT